MDRKIKFIILSVLVAVLLLSCGGEKEVVDGNYTVEVSLSGGSGRAKVDSPAAVSVENGKFTARIVWSSKYYSYMIVNGERFEPVSEFGERSAFEIPVVMDTDMNVSACTEAMSEPHLIDYVLRFDGSSLKEKII